MTTELSYYSSVYCTIKFLEYSGCDFERIRALFYAIWSVTSIGMAIAFWGFGNDTFIITGFPFFVHTVNFVYGYELLLHRPDKAHVAHHVVTMILQCMIYYSSWGFISPYHLILTSTAYQGFVSSIFSSVRTVSIAENWPTKPLWETVYLYSYLICKIGGTVGYYLIWYIHSDRILVADYEYIFVTYSVIHAIQMYFSHKIVRKLMGGRTSPQTPS